ncbi:hypothetical protein F7734_09855 [Scytonema sp. UIC 10036]|uniref:hypothetical protein n=1 Tax=Scytonema sp. UIC 10036 TaxID=2304196 RepID=UPI0012DA6656|nr:hypothetical protein [Scytonema sp. UIC 10036]MUG92735.1 hypothetical protein [Scytonema sp. UIC 10036]
MSIKLVIFSFCATVFYASPVLAQSVSAFKDSSGQVYLFNLTPGSTIEVDLTKDLTRAVVANACGVISVKSSQSFTVDGQTYNPADNLELKQNVPSNCTDLAGYPTVFKTNTGAIAITGKTSGTAYTVQIPNNKSTRKFTVNPCGFVRLGKEVVSSTLGLPTSDGGKANFELSYFPESAPLSCIKGQLYYPVGFNKGASVTASAGGGSGSGGGSTGATAPTNPSAAKNGNNFILQNLINGTYKVSNATNPVQFKNVSVTKSCLVVDRTTIGSPSTLMVTGSSFTGSYPYSWIGLTTTSIPSC